MDNADGFDTESLGDLEQFLRRLTRLLPDDQSFILLGYDPEAAKVTIDDLADDVFRVIDQHLNSRADVVGISYGCVVASRLAMRSPQSIGKLVLITSAPWFSHEGKRRLKRQIDLIDTGDLNALLRDFTSMFRSPWLNLLARLRVRLGGKRIVQKLGKADVIRRYLEAMLESDPPVDSSAFQRTPTIVVGGSRDQFFAEAMAEAHVSTPDIETSIFENETHMVPIERAKEVKQIISDFFSSR
ncbi:alpha/beta fold hydrolase [Rhizobium laguerreae]|uniref:alpha/beta fold hydrolase n=1 Tax=Rhizobium laguerreae TaxID=1076926 RepID=UPI0035E3FBF8